MSGSIRSLFVICAALAVLLASTSGSCDAANYALVIGIDQYQQSDRINALAGAANDARSLAKTLQDVAGVPPANLRLLVSDTAPQPTAANILLEVDRLAKRVKPGDTVYVLFSGHGIDIDGTTYLVPWDADAHNDATLQRTALRTGDLRSRLGKIPAKTLLLGFDMCRNDPRSGARDIGDNNLLGPNQARDLKVVPAGGRTGPQSVITLFACSEGQRSWEWHDKQRGFFSYFLEQGLRHDAADNKGVVHVGNLVSYLVKAVYGAVQREEGEAQTPYPLVEPQNANDTVLVVGVPAGAGGTTAVVALDNTSAGRFDAALQQGYELSQQQRWPEAQARFQTAFSLRPDSGKAADGLGRTYAAQRQWDQAEPLFRKAVELDSKNGSFVNDLADTLYARHDIPGAVQTYRDAMELDPNNMDPVMDLALIYHKDKKDDDEASQLLRRAMRINPKDPNPVDTLGTIYYEKGEYAAAEPLYRQAVRMDLGNGKYLAHLAKCLVKQGKVPNVPQIPNVPNAPQVPKIPKIRLPGGFHF